MTRDEAIEAMNESLGNSGAWRGNWVDAFAALGMLKLDEPKSVDVKAVEVIAKYGKDHGYLVIGDAINIIDRLHTAGLKIVETNSAVS